MKELSQELRDLDLLPGGMTPKSQKPARFKKRIGYMIYIYIYGYIMTWKLLKKLGYDPFFRSGNLVPSIVIFASWMFLEYRATSGAVGKLFYPICFCRTSNVGCMFAGKIRVGEFACFTCYSSSRCSSTAQVATAQICSLGRLDVLSSSQVSLMGVPSTCQSSSP